MNTIFKIARIELQKMFYSPIAWLILIIFTVQASLSFMPFMENFVRSKELNYGLYNMTATVFASGRGWFAGLLSNIYLYIPLLTMGLLSREFSSGSVKLLYSSPISNMHIVLGKFLSTVIFALAMTFILFIFVLFGSFVIDNFDFPLALTGLLGIFLLICTYSAIGLFFSSLTSYQVVAAMGTFATFFALNSVSQLWQSVDFVRDITYWLAISGRCQSFVSGLICSEDLLYFILVSGLFLSFSILRLKGIREKSKRYISCLRYIGSFAIVAFLGYLSTNPYLMGFHDSTYTDSNTLTKNSQDIIKKVKGKTTITTYVNLHGNAFWSGLPSNINNDLERYTQYRRFKPDIKIRYKYYYAPPIEEDALKSYHQRYAGLSEKEILDKVTKVYSVNKNRYQPASAFKDEMNLKAELNRFVRKIETEDGKVSILRTYNDMYTFPFESQKTAAFKRFVTEIPVVGFVSGHQERDVNNIGDRGFHTIAKEITFRSSLVNNGMDFKEIDLSKPIDKNINIIVIAEGREPYSEENINVLNDYIDRGGNLVIACDRKRQDIMNPLVESFGVKFLQGQVVQYNKGYDKDLVTCKFTAEGEKLAYQFHKMVSYGQVVAMPGAVAISYENLNKDFKAIPVLVTDTIEPSKVCDTLGSWNELQTTNFVDDIAHFDPKTEICCPITEALALSRKINNKEQKILILGDADCFSNGEAVGRNRRGIRAANFDFFNGLFFWLTDSESPIDVRRPNAIDNELFYLKESNITFWNIFFEGFLSVLLTFGCVFIWLRRRSR